MSKTLCAALAIVMMALALCSCSKLDFGDSDESTGNNTGEYVPVASFSEGLAVVKSGSKYGYADKRGHVVIPCEYDEAESFRDGVAYVEFEDKGDDIRGYIDATGKLMFNYADVEKKYKDVYSFSEGLMAAVTDDGGCLYINFSGEEVIYLDEDFSLPEIEDSEGGHMFDFHEGYTFVGFDNSICCISTSGKVNVLNADVVSVMLHTQEGVAVLLIKQEGKYAIGVYTPGDDKLCVYSDDEFDEEPTVMYYPDDEVIKCDTSNETLLIDKNGKLIANLTEKYEDCAVGDFSGSVAPISYREDGEIVMAYIGTKAELITESQNKYNLGSYSDGYAIWYIGEEGKVFIADDEFEIVKEVSDADSENANSYVFSQGYALISKGGEEALIDTDGDALEIRYKKSYAENYDPDTEPVEIAINRAININSTTSGEIDKDDMLIGYWVAKSLNISNSTGVYLAGVHEIVNEKIDNKANAKAYLDIYDDGTVVFDIYISGLVDIDGTASWSKTDDERYEFTVSGKSYRLVRPSDASLDLYIFDDERSYIAFENDNAGDPPMEEEIYRVILPDVKTHVYTEEEIQQAIQDWLIYYTEAEVLRFARNECFANYGNVFEDVELNRYFYVERSDYFISNSSLTADEIYEKFNSVERKNIKTIKQMEEKYK